MISLDAGTVRGLLGEGVINRLAAFEAFDEIESTNSYLMHQAGPRPGRVRIALTDNQTRGRGRHGRTWLSPPGSGLCISVAHSYAVQPANLPALTLAIGVAVIESLEKVGVSGVQLKWPNDLVADNGKLGGILTETQAQRPGAITVVTGVGLNVELGGEPDLGIEADRALRVVDLASYAPSIPSREQLAAHLIDNMCAVLVDYETGGFEPYADRWAECDWLLGRALTVEAAQREVTGVGAGIADDGALLVDSGLGALHRITSGSVVVAGVREPGA